MIKGWMGSIRNIKGYKYSEKQVPGRKWKVSEK